MTSLRNSKWIVSLSVGLLVFCLGLPSIAQEIPVQSLAELRALGVSGVNNITVKLSTLFGDPHPVTGQVTPGVYWIHGTHIANPTNSHPIFMELGGSGNTYDLSGTTIKLDTRRLDGFGRNLGHDSGVDVIRISGANNTVKGLTLIGEDVALDTDPNAQRYADWATVFVEMSGDDNMVDGATVVTRGSRTDAYGLGDAFGKGSSGGIAPFLAHRKASAFRVGEATNAVINDMHLEVNTFGHGFFVQASTNTTLTNSTVTGELFPSQDVIDHPLYQQHGVTYWQNEIPNDILISGAEGGVRMYTGSSGLTCDNVVVTNMRTGFATSLGGGTVSLNNCECYGVEAGFGFGNNTTITNAKADGINGPVVIVDRDIRSNSSIELELVGNQPFNHPYALVYVNGNNMNVSITSSRPAEDFENTTIFRSAQFWYENWRENNDTTIHDVPGYDQIDSTLINNTNQLLILGEQASGNTGSSLGGVISNGKDNEYDGVTFVLGGTRLTLEHVNGLGNGGTAADESLDANGSIVEDGATLEIQPGLSIQNEILLITGDGVDGKGALYSDGETGTGTRFGSSNNSDESTIFLDGDASIGAGVAGNQLLVGRIQGFGNLTKLGPGTLTMGKSSTFDGDLIVAQGRIEGRTGVVHRNLTVAVGASVAPIANNFFNTTGDVLLNGVLDVNGRTGNFTSYLTGKIGRLNGNGRITSSADGAGSGGSLELSVDGGGLFIGSIDGNVSLLKSGNGDQSLYGNMTHTGTTTVTEGGLYVNGPHTGGDDYFVDDTGTLGGIGVIDAPIEINGGGHLTPGPMVDPDSNTGTLFASDVVFRDQSKLIIEIASDANVDKLLLSGVMTVESGAVLELVLADGFVPAAGDQFAIIGFESLVGEFDTFAAPALTQAQWDFSQLNSQGIISVIGDSVLLGDCNLDGVVNLFDISPFISLVTSGSYLDQGDCNEDGMMNLFDISPFIAILTAG